MLFLSDLMLSHFRSHKQTKLHLDWRPVAIFGPNGSGKTNILEAVSLFSPGRGLRRAGAAEMGMRSVDIGWKLAGVLRRGPQNYEVTIKSEGGAARRVHIDAKPAAQTQLAQISRVVWLVPAMDRLWIEGAENRRRFLDRMAMSFFPDHAEHSLVFEKAMRERNRLLKDNIRDAHWYKALEHQMAQSGEVIEHYRQATIARIIAAQNQADTAFPVAELALEYLDAPMPTTAGDYALALHDTRSRDLAAGRTLIGPHRADLVGRFSAKDIAAKDCSTGEQKALLVSMILANARSLATETGLAPMILLDEVSAHLDADRRAALYDEICALGAQAWLTGTEAHFFAELGERAQYLRVSVNETITQVHQLGHRDLQ